MRSWDGTRIRTEALTVPCRWCHAGIGEPCVTAGQPLRAFPAHEVRVREARKHAEETK